MSKAQRDKGRRGQLEARHMLQSRDFSVGELNGGTSSEDFIACDLVGGKTYSVEVKNTIAITVAHRKQAMEQARQRRLPWMLLNKISGTSSWLVQREGDKPVVWTA